MSDTLQGPALDVHPRIGSYETLEEKLNTKEPSWREAQDIVKKARLTSAPGPRPITYKVYKRCPMLLRRLWNLLRRIRIKGIIPTSRKRADGRLCLRKRTHLTKADSEPFLSLVSNVRSSSLLSPTTEADFVHGEEQVHRHINPEGRYPRFPSWSMRPRRAEET